MMDVENVGGDCLDVVTFKTRKSEVKYEHVSCQVDQHVQVSRVGGGDKSALRQLNARHRSKTESA